MKKDALYPSAIGSDQLEPSLIRKSSDGSECGGSDGRAPPHREADRRGVVAHRQGGEVGHAAQKHWCSPQVSPGVEEEDRRDPPWLAHPFSFFPFPLDRFSCSRLDEFLQFLEFDWISNSAVLARFGDFFVG